jgi:hypothetical protein
MHLIPEIVQQAAIIVPGVVQQAAIIPEWIFKHVAGQI